MHRSERTIRKLEGQDVKCSNVQEPVGKDSVSDWFSNDLPILATADDEDV